MNKQNSIIGCGYIPRNVQAVCLKTKNNATLGEAEYKIISEVYERKFELSGLCAAIAGKKAVARAAINVLDANTGLTYAVVYEPANLVRTTPEPGAGKPEGKVEFADRARQITEELGEAFNNGGVILEKCGVAFFAISDDGNNETSTCMCFLGGRGDRVAKAIASACSQNPQALEIMKHASVEAILRRMFGGSNNKDDNK